MSQHDMAIADTDGLSFLNDLNDALPALASTSIGPSAPGTPYDGQQWIDNSGTPWVLNVYDLGNTTWIELGNINTTTGLFEPAGYVLSAGVWTPTVSNTVNLASTTAYECMYSQVGNTATGSGTILLDPTATGSIGFQLSLPPVASNFVGTRNAAGTISNAGDFLNGTVKANAANDTLEIVGVASSLSAFTAMFTFSYKVI